MTAVLVVPRVLADGVPLVRALVATVGTVSAVSVVPVGDGFALVLGVVINVAMD